MKKLRMLSLIVLVAGTIFTSGCKEVCESCGLRPGTVVTYIDAESQAHERVVGQDGCVRFEADDCSEHTAIDERDPSHGIILE